MTLAGWTLLMAALLSAPEDVAERPVSLSVWAIEATNPAREDTAPNRTPIGGRTLAEGATSQRTPIGSGMARSMVAPRTTGPPSPARRFDDGAKPLERILADIPYTDFKTLYATRQNTAYRQDAVFPVCPKYKMFITPLDKEPDGRIRVNVRVEIPPERPEDKPVNALETRLVMAPGKEVKLRGFRLPQGELVIVLLAGG